MSGLTVILFLKILKCLVQKRSLCVVEEELIKAFSEDGNIESSALPFKVSQCHMLMGVRLGFCNL
jgi:hypothetical protein